jgi:hypothetical protein
MSFPLKRRWPKASGAAVPSQPGAAAAYSVQGRKRGNGLRLGPKAKWVSCFLGKKKENWVGLLWMLGRIPKKNRKIGFLNFGR